MEEHPREIFRGPRMIYLSVVIPTHNRIAMLERVLEGLSAQEDPPEFEVIVIDDGSVDDTRVRVDAAVAAGRYGFPFRFVSQPNGGPGTARNAGTSLASGHYVVFIGDDTVPESRFLFEHARAHLEHEDNPKVACLGYTGWPAGERVTPFMEYINDYGLQFGYALIEHANFVPFNFFYTSNISIDRELLLQFPFDTSFPAAAWEDIELAYRLEKAGVRIYFNRKAVTRHYHPMSIDTFARRQYTVGKSGAIFFSKHPELGHFLGVHEVEKIPAPNSAQVRKLRLFARAGEKFWPLARPAAFERLMRFHYLHGLRDGLRELEKV